MKRPQPVLFLVGMFFLLVTLAERWIIRWHPESTH